MPAPGMDHQRLLLQCMWASLAASICTIGLKVLAAVMTGSVGFLSDAMESGVNLIAAAVGLGALTVAARPPDDAHEFGHGKAEYLSAGVEGALVFVAAGAILWTSIRRLQHPMPLEQAGWGLALSTGASLVNLGVGLLLVRAGRRHRSMAVVADGRHLLTDVWTSAGVLVGIALVALTHWQPLDPIVALLVGVNILRIGFDLVRRSLSGLLDAALPAGEVARIEAVLERYRTAAPVRIDPPKTREAGRQRFAHLTVFVPGEWTVRQGHRLTEDIEAAVERDLPGTITYVHLEPLPEGQPALGPGSPVEPASAPAPVQEPPRRPGSGGTRRRVLQKARAHGAAPLAHGADPDAGGPATPPDGARRRRRHRR